MGSKQSRELATIDDNNSRKYKTSIYEKREEEEEEINRSTINKRRSTGIFYDITNMNSEIMNSSKVKIISTSQKSIQNNLNLFFYFSNK
jgi:hypothetical protein